MARKVLGCLLISLAMALLYVSPLGQRLERDFGLGALYAVRGALDPPGEALVIGYDRGSVGWLARNIHDIGQVSPALDGCLTPRSREVLAGARNVNHVPRVLHACLVRELAVRDPRLIVFDINFNAEKPEDIALAGAIHEAGNVLLLEKIAGGAGGAMAVRLSPAVILRDAALGTVGFQVDGSGSEVTTGYASRFAEFPGLQVMPVEAWRRFLGRDEPPGSGKAGFRHFWLYGPPGTVPTLSVRDVLEANSASPLPESLTDRVIFIGASDPVGGTSDDHFKIPRFAGGHDRISGVELAATAFLNLLHGEPLRVPSGLARTALVLAFALVAAMCGMLPAGSRGLAAIASLAAAYSAGAAAAFSAGGLWLPVVTPVFVVAPLAAALALESRYRLARSLVARLAPPQFAEKLLDDPETERHGMEVEQATVMFTDLIGSTALAEGMPELEVSEVMARYYDHATAAVDEHGGMIVDYRGDGILAIFPESVTGADHAARACLAAIEIGTGMPQDGEASPADRLELRIGLNTGAVAVGSVGARNRYNYNALGDSVNVAARLEQHAKTVERRGSNVIVVSQATRDASDLPDGHFEPLGSVRLRGRASETPVFRLHPTREPS